MSVIAKRPCVYILASKRNGTLYIGVTSDLPKRMGQHKESIIPGFTADHGVALLVWFEDTHLWILPPLPP
jgi:putative endonuclease